MGILPPCVPKLLLIYKLSGPLKFMSVQLMYLIYVDHFVLFKKLLERGIPVPITRFVLRWYHNHLVWNSIDPSL